MTEERCPDDRRLLHAARMAAQNAYAPASKFAVGAALLGVDGRIFVGCNVENASFGLTICAERGAVCRAVADGAREFSKVAIWTPSDPPGSPCGACRQVLAEFGPNMEVLLTGPSGRVDRHLLADLLPMSFRFDYPESSPPSSDASPGA